MGGSESIWAPCFRTTTPPNLYGNSWEGDPFLLVSFFTSSFHKTYSCWILDLLQFSTPLKALSTPLAAQRLNIAHPLCKNFLQGHVWGCGRLLLIHGWWVRGVAFQWSCIQMGKLIPERKGISQTRKIRWPSWGLKSNLFSLLVQLLINLTKGWCQKERPTLSLFRIQFCGACPYIDSFHLLSNPVRWELGAPALTSQLAQW